MAPTLGIVILNYNYARFVGGAIRSVLDQTVPFDEIVVVDDGSTDDSLQRIRAFEPRVRVIAQANSGQMRGSMAGLAALGTDYAYILDADDSAHPDLVASVRPHLSADPVKVQFAVRSMDEDGQPMASEFPHFPPAYAAEDMIRDNALLGFYVAPPTAGNIYRRSYLTGLDLGHLGANDPVDGVPSMIAPWFGPVVTLPRPLASYRVHGNGHSQWGRPTVALLEREILWVHQRWDAAKVLAPGRVTAPDPEATAFVTERRMMIAALSGGAVPATVAAFLRQLARGGGPAITRAGLSAWAVSMLVPSRAFRRRLVLARRSPEARPAFLNAAVVRVKRALSAPRRALARVSGS